jgi:hypothetical protein
MSYKVDVQINKKQFGIVKAALDRIQVHASRAGKATVHVLAERYYKDIRAWYGAGIPPGLTMATRQKRAQGKRAGRTPALPAFPGNKPLSRSNTLQGLVRVDRQATAKTATRRVYVQPGIPLPGGGISDKVGIVHEEGREYSFIATKAVRIYLRALALGIAGTGENLRPEDMPRGGNVQITVRIPARPIWGPVFKTYLSQQPFGPNGYARIFAMELLKRTKIPIKFS